MAHTHATERERSGERMICTKGRTRLSKERSSDFTGQRIDTVTYICQHPGQFILPALVIPWWDLKHQRLMHVTLQAMTLEVASGFTSSTDAAAVAAETPGSR
jgi:hypothetical protein